MPMMNQLTGRPRLLLLCQEDELHIDVSGHKMPMMNQLTGLPRLLLLCQEDELHIDVSGHKTDGTGMGGETVEKKATPEVERQHQSRSHKNEYPPGHEPFGDPGGLEERRAVSQDPPWVVVLTCIVL
ncbi:hypothetical protein HUJ04_010329 [Dendroctonus ponderosae]|nr:hypothetical protein HUJ04_010329 [Dendroctonus ponderosae]